MENKLNHNHTFDHLVIGSHNQFAHAALTAVLEQPGTLYNPIYIHGHRGTGKTHLIGAVANQIENELPEKKWIFISTEDFNAECLAAIKNDAIEAFIQKYSSPDFLIMDDFQYLRMSDTVQDEFLKICENLLKKNAQIILCGDRAPYEIPMLKDQLLRPILCGLVAEVTMPTSKERIKILQVKTKQFDLAISNEIEVFTYIADRYDTNIRIMENALNRVVSYAKMKNESTSKALAIEALASYNPEV